MKLLYSVLVLLFLFQICNAQLNGNNHDDFLGPQNAERAQVGIEPFKWDSTLQKYAEDYMNKRKSDCLLEHSNGPYGENLFWGGGQDFSNSEAVSEWIKEKQFYHYDANSCDRGQMCGHYTQVVWRDSTDVGCARMLCDNGGLLIICSYNPPGNYYGQKPY